jgi:hypothetical protein
MLSEERKSQIVKEYQTIDAQLKKLTQVYNQYNTRKIEIEGILKEDKYEVDSQQKEAQVELSEKDKK